MIEQSREIDQIQLSLIRVYPPANTYIMIWRLFGFEFWSKIRQQIQDTRLDPWPEGTRYLLQDL